MNMIKRSHYTALKQAGKEGNGNYTNGKGDPDCNPCVLAHITKLDFFGALIQNTAHDLTC